MPNLNLNMTFTHHQAEPKSRIVKNTSTIHPTQHLTITHTSNLIFKPIMSDPWFDRYMIYSLSQSNPLWHIPSNSVESTLKHSLWQLTVHPNGHGRFLRWIKGSRNVWWANSFSNHMFFTSQNEFGVLRTVHCTLIWLLLHSQYINTAPSLNFSIFKPEFESPSEIL